MTKTYLSCLIGCCILISINCAAQISPTNIITGQLISVGPKVTSLPTSYPATNKQGDAEINVVKRVRFPGENANANSADGSLQSAVNTNAPQAVSGMGATFDGNGQVDNAALGFGGLTPPDPTMAVGPNHVVQMINLAHSVYAKNGVRLTGPVKFSAIAPGASDNGDPIALYDYVADRWILLQFDLPAGAQSLIFAVSKTNDPSGAYNVYKFLTPGVFPDYPHVGIWNGSYTITTHEFNTAGTAYIGQGFYAVDRTKMLSGQPTSTLIRFSSAADGGFLPVSQEGLKTPELNSPAGFFGYDADEYGAGHADQLLYRTMNVNFANPAASTLSANINMPTSSFDGREPTTTRSTVDQQGTTAGIQAIADRMMSRIIYRRFDNYESVVMNHGVNISGVAPTNKATFQCAMRWYELRRATPASAWTIHQQSTFAPTAVSGATGIDRFMGSIGIDQKGSVAIAYSGSSTTLFPGIYYAEHKVTDAASIMGAEQTFFPGGGSQTSAASRWGDYSSITTDPSNEDSLWFTTEYYAATAATNFKTRIGRFKIDMPVAPEVHYKTGGTIARQNEASTQVSAGNCLRYKDYLIPVMVDVAPSQPVNITFSTSGTATQGVDYQLVFPAPFVLNAANLSRDITLRVFDDAQNEPDEFVDISYTLNFNGGNGVAATYNQKHRITIFGKATDLTEFTAITYGAATQVFADNFDAVTTGLGAWTEQQVFLTAGATNPNHFKIGAKGGLGFTNQSLYISDNNDTIRYADVTPAAAEPESIIRAVSPSINITGKGQVSVSFVFKCSGENGFDFGALFYSKDGGTNWITAESNLRGQTTTISKTINLPADVENLSNLKIAFQWHSDYSILGQPPFGVDNVVVTAKPKSENAQVQQAVNTLTAGTFNFGPNQTVHFIDTVTKKVIATITNNSNTNYGCTKVEIDRAGTGAEVFNSTYNYEKVASKTFKVTPEFNTGGSYSIRLYYTEAEIAGWESGSGLPRSVLDMVKVSGSNSVGSVTPANHYGIQYNVVPATLGTFGTDGITVDATFSAFGFSGFGIGKPKGSIILPVTLLQFKGNHINKKGNQLDWMVTNQVNLKTYEIQSSMNGTDFTTIGSVNARAYSGNNLKYDFMDLRYGKGANYYRLKMIDTDGKFKYSDVIIINITESGYSVTAYPNPVTNKLFVDYRGTSKILHVQIIDAAGRMIYDAKKGVERVLALPAESLLPGTYTLKITDDSESFTSKFIKQ